MQKGLYLLATGTVDNANAGFAELMKYYFIAIAATVSIMLLLSVAEWLGTKDTNKQKQIVEDGIKRIVIACIAVSAVSGIVGLVGKILGVTGLKV